LAKELVSKLTPSGERSEADLQSLYADASNIGAYFDLDIDITPPPRIAYI